MYICLGPRKVGTVGWKEPIVCFSCFTNTDEDLMSMTLLSSLVNSPGSRRPALQVSSPNLIPTKCESLGVQKVCGQSSWHQSLEQSKMLLIVYACVLPNHSYVGDMLLYYYLLYRGVYLALTRLERPWIWSYFSGTPNRAIHLSNSIDKQVCVKELGRGDASGQRVNIFTMVKMYAIPCWRVMVTLSRRECFQIYLLLVAY